MHDYSRHTTDGLLALIKSKTEQIRTIVIEDYVDREDRNDIETLAAQVLRIVVVLKQREAQLPMWHDK